MDHVVQALALYECFRGIPDALVFAGLAPGVLDHIILLAELILGDAEDLHAVVVRNGFFVEALLTGLLSDWGDDMFFKAG